MAMITRLLRCFFQAVLLGLLFTPRCGSAQTEEPLTLEQKVADLALLWQEVNYNFVHFDKVPDLDWDSTFQAFIPQVVATESRIELIRVLQRFVALLREGHTNVVPPRELWTRYAAAPPLELDVIEELPVVVNATTATVGDVPIGSVVLSVDGEPVGRYLDEQVIPFISAATEHDRLRKAIQGKGEPAIGLLVGEVETEVAITFETPSGEIRTGTLTRDHPDSEQEWARTPVDQRPLFSIRWLEGEIALIEINGFYSGSVAEDFRNSLQELKRAKAIVFDVRKNPGGNSANGTAIARHFQDTAMVARAWVAREHVSAFKAWGRYQNAPEYREYFESRAWGDTTFTNVDPAEENRLLVPVAVLSGRDTYSAAENFVEHMSGIPRVVVVGEHTAGSTGQPLILELSCGAWAAITSLKALFPDGTDLVGRGVPPDMEVRQTIEAFRQGRDPVLERAVEELRRRIRGGGTEPEKGRTSLLVSKRSPP
jgi:C-terminal processing protease CtpA/Prc